MPGIMGSNDGKRNASAGIFASGDTATDINPTINAAIVDAMTIEKSNVPLLISTSLVECRWLLLSHNRNKCFWADYLWLKNRLLQ